MPGGKRNRLSLLQCIRLLGPCYNHSGMDIHKYSKAVKIILFNALLALLLLSGVELAWLYALGSPSFFARLPGNVKVNIRSQYMDLDRNIIQYMPECARFDPQLTYTLKPGECTFENPEFRNRISINSLGVRDDETSLDSPEVIVLGDSLTMGWGVDNMMAFPFIIEKKSGKKVLSAAVSSYGTVREVLLMDRVDTSALEYLIIQYSDNDFSENISFDRTPRRPPEFYESIVIAHADEKKYYFGKHIVRYIRALLDMETANPPQYTVTSATAARGPLAEVQYFLKALLRSSSDLSGVRIIVTEIGLNAHNDKEFTGALREGIKQEGLPGHISGMEIIDLSGILSSDDYYQIDDHLNSSGHRKIAEAVLSAMSEEKMPSVSQ